MSVKEMDPVGVPFADETLAVNFAVPPISIVPGKHFSAALVAIPVITWVIEAVDALNVPVG